MPVRFVDDEFSFTKVGNDHYAFNSLKLREVKLYHPETEGEIFVKSIDKYFALTFNFNSETSKKFKTIVTQFDNDFEEREQQFDYLQQRFILILKRGKVLWLRRKYKRICNQYEEAFIQKVINSTCDTTKE